ncbi:hypothetical protein Clacol_008737 [Clathrus columnatus]|uniref:F-box domain-containing protein n=1 Tax=Clathrus columnatus TaxID=1419009 RepID=A0AAV5AP68_9AGAM|nr:hypothetical protein Clacol_008737 [Clathrus columnatus]
MEYGDGDVSNSQSSLAKITARQTSILQNAQSTINQLPVEIFIKIISFAGHPSIKKPYPYVALSWVCHYWRVAILGNAVFWNTIIVGRITTSASSIPMKELLQRSQNAPLHIIVQRNELQEVFTLIQHFPTIPSRVKTFHWTIHWCFAPGSPPLSDLLSLFPSLENIFCYSSSGTPSILTLIPASLPSQLKAMQISVKHSIGNLADPGLFCNLRWLSFTYVYNVIPLPSLLKAFQNLPSLQFLHFFGSPQPTLETMTEGDAESIITLRELIVLITNCPIIHLIDAPKLSHLDVSALYSYSPESSVHDAYYDQLCGFNFSKITRIRSEMIRGCVSPSITANPSYKWKDVENVSWSSWSSFGDYRYNSGLKWIFDESPTSYCPNQFHLSFGEHRTERPPALIPTFVSYIEKATNLDEIILTRLDLSSLSRADVDSFSNALKAATSVRKLTILSGNSLKDLCELLNNGSQVLSRLEKLSYSASYDKVDDTGHSYISSSLCDLVKGRSMTGFGFFQIELSNFPSLHPREFRRTQDLGLELRQQGGKLLITVRPGKRSGKVNPSQISVDWADDHNGPLILRL